MHGSCILYMKMIFYVKIRGEGTADGTDGRKGMENRQMKRWIQFAVFLSVTIILIAGIVPLTWLIVQKHMGMKLTAADDYLYKTIDDLTLSRDGFYEIRSAEDYRIFWNAVRWQDESINGRLMSNIELNDTSDWQEWGEVIPTYITAPVSKYSGVFDGQGHTISGIYSEQGYGIVDTNEGIIRNLIIVDSVVSGGFHSGGICYNNKDENALISNCIFYGKIAEVTARNRIPDKFAGICVANSGTVIRCGFMGEMVADNSEHSEKYRAGICTNNYGNIEECYNFSYVDETDWENNKNYAIADQGEQNCYALKDSGWEPAEEGQTMMLSVMQSLQLEEYLNQDILALWQQSLPPYATTSLTEIQGLSMIEEALQDEVIKDMVFWILSRKQEDFGDIHFQAVKENEAEFCLTIELQKESLQVKRYAAENTDNVEELWNRESRILSEKNADTWNHTTYTLLPAEAPAEDTEFIMSYQTEGEAGIFYTKGDHLYQFVPNESTTMDEDEDTLLQITETELCFHKAKSTGINWKDETVREAVYAALTEGEDILLSREEVRNLEQLEIINGEEIETLRDLENLPVLTSLVIYGDGGELTAIKELKQIPLTNLTELILCDCGIRDISFLSQYKKLTMLSLGNNEIKDISVLEEFPELITLALHSNRIENIDSLRNMKDLTILNLTDNQITDLSPLAGKTKLTMLGLSYNRITDITPLKGMTNLVNLSVGSNYVEDISVLSDMKKLQWLGLECNRIEDFSAVLEMKRLFYLDVMGNPSQEIGDLYFTPYLLVGNWGTEVYAGGLADAQVLLNRFPSQQGIVAEDMAYGDLNNDGIRDVAITGYFGEKKNEEGYIEEWGTRQVYVFTGTAAGDYELCAAVETLGPDNGGIYGDPYQGISISGNHLIVQNYGGSNFRWADTDIYEYRNGTLQETYSFYLNYWLWNSGGYDWYVYDHIRDTEKKYAVQGEWDQPVNMVLIRDGADEGSDEYQMRQKQYDSALQILEQKAEESIGRKLPEFSFWHYGPDVDDDGYYFYEIHESLAPTRKKADDVLSFAAEKYFSLYEADCVYFPVLEYTSEEIKKNYDLLAGVELPVGFYVGRDPFGEWRMLSYESCFQDEDGSYVHVLDFRKAVIEDDYSRWSYEIVYYYESTGALVRQ